MEIALRHRILVGVFATVVIVGSGVATALVASSDGPTVGAAVDITSPTSTIDTVAITTPSTLGVTSPTTPPRAGDAETDGTGDDVARYWDPVECGGADVVNHGPYVSSQPKDGEARSAAARSDCGKPLAGVGDDGDASGDDSGDAPEVEAPDADGGSSPSAEHGKSASAPGRTK